MTDLTLKRLLLGSTLLFGLSAAPAFAQASNTTGVPEVDEQRADGVFEQTIVDNDDEFIEEVIDGEMDELIVTGSRLRRDTFSSITPLETIDTDFAATQGLFNPVEILQSSSSAAGVQIDSSFGGFVLDNGPGSETVDLRGLGAQRTLVTVDGRRLAPSGVEGAPSVPSINAIPVTFVDQFDLLLDGASSVYGSDAVAGVANLILKRDFDGLEIDARTSLPEQGGGEEYIVGLSYGINADRGFVGVQGEYRERQNFTIGDRDFLAGCETYVEETVDGEIRTGNQFNNYLASLAGLSAPVDECLPTRLTQRIIPSGNRFGSIYYQPGIANTGIGAFSESTLFSVPLDFNEDGVRDVNFADFSPNGQQQDLQDFFNDQTVLSGRIVGEYTLEGAANITPYFDVIYTDLAVDSIGQQPQLFPLVNASNPFNPCNIDSPNGTDCAAAQNDVLTDPRYISAFQNFYNNPDAVPFGGSANCFGAGRTPTCSPEGFGLLVPTGSSQAVRPVVGVLGDRNTTDVDIRNTRIVGGVRGDIPGLRLGAGADFNFDISGVYSRSDSDSLRSGIRGDRLDLALGNSGVGGVPCAAQPGTPADVANGCVPVNLFAPSLYTQAAGADFASQAERDYLFDVRDFSTSYEQTVLNAFVSGSLFELPGGNAQIGIGAEYRIDDIDSQPDDVARDGLFFGFFSDGGASGSVDKRELFGEVVLPLGTGDPGFREFTLEAAGRLTDDEFYGTNETYSLKAGWRPIDSLLLRGTYGTSFLAPTVRELFLAGQTGFNTLADPCAAPDDNAVGGGDVIDNRNPNLLAQCVADGLDPTTFRAGNPFTSVEISSGGVEVGEANLTLDPETSTSFTVGAAFDQPFTDLFDLEIGLNYYEYDIENTFGELTAGFILASCYDSQPGINPACAFIRRDFSASAVVPGSIDLISESFINLNGETAKGLDINVDFGMDDLNVLGQNTDLFLVADLNRQHERLFIDNQIDPETGETLADEEELVGEFGFAKWRGRLTGGAVVDKFGLTWTARYIGSVEVDEEELNVAGFSNFIDSEGDIVTTGGESLGDVDARRVSDAGDVWYHSASLRYAYDEDISFLVGVNNIFDREPPLVDGREVLSVGNAPIGAGYDLNGRSFIARLNTRF